LKNKFLTSVIAPSASDHGIILMSLPPMAESFQPEVSPFLLVFISKLETDAI
jgi:hypothetical protein